MQKQFFFLSPVEVVKVTSQNLEEVAEWCGGKIATTESRRVPGRMDSYVWVPTPKGTSISWAFPGMFITKRLVRTVKDEIRVTFAVFRKDYFDKNYFDTPKAAADETWERQAKDEKKAAAPKPTAPKKNQLKGTSMEDYIPAEKPEAVADEEKLHVHLASDAVVDVSEAIRQGVQEQEKPYYDEVGLEQEVAPEEAQETVENTVTGGDVAPVQAQKLSKSEEIRLENERRKAMGDGPSGSE